MAEPALIMFWRAVNNHLKSTGAHHWRCNVEITCCMGNKYFAQQEWYKEPHVVLILKLVLACSSTGFFVSSSGLTQRIILLVWGRNHRKAEILSSAIHAWCYNSIRASAFVVEVLSNSCALSRTIICLRYDVGPSQAFFHQFSWLCLIFKSVLHNDAVVSKIICYVLK